MDIFLNFRKEQLSRLFATATTATELERKAYRKVARDICNMALYKQDWLNISERQEYKNCAKCRAIFFCQIPRVTGQRLHHQKFNIIDNLMNVPTVVNFLFPPCPQNSFQIAF